MLNTASKLMSSTFRGRGSGSPLLSTLPSCNQLRIPGFEIPAAGITISNVFSGENSTAALKAATKASQDETSQRMDWALWPASVMVFTVASASVVFMSAIVT